MLGKYISTIRSINLRDSLMKNAPWIISLVALLFSAVVWAQNTFVTKDVHDATLVAISQRLDRIEHLLDARLVKTLP